MRCVMGRSCAGLLSLAIVMLSGCSGMGSSRPAISVTVTPNAASVVVNQPFAFQDTVMGTTNTAVTWQVGGITGGNSTVGTISATGSYTAPASVPNPAKVTITAVSEASPSAKGSASVLISASNINQQPQNTPIELGTSGGNENDSSIQGNQITCCSGTLGSLVERTWIFYILSNNHVLAKRDNGQIGDAIIQPGLGDTNCSPTGTTTVANLTQFANLQTAGTNVDAAIAQIVTGTVD